MEVGMVLDFLVGLWAPLKIVIECVGGAAVVAVVVIKLTPSKADDEFLENLKAKVPLLGGLLAYLVGKAPIQEKK